MEISPWKVIKNVWGFKFPLKVTVSGPIHQAVSLVHGLEPLYATESFKESLALVG